MTTTVDMTLASTVERHIAYSDQRYADATLACAVLDLVDRGDWYAAPAEVLAELAAATQTVVRQYEQIVAAYPDEQDVADHLAWLRQQRDLFLADLDDAGMAVYALIGTSS